MIDRGILNGVSPSSANIQKGECPITIQWDFDALSNKDQNPNMNLQVVIPSDGTVAGMYIQFVTAGAPHPNAAKLLMEYEYSDEGQLAYAQGFVHPIRTSVKLPADSVGKIPAGMRPISPFTSPRIMWRSIKPGVQLQTAGR